MHAGIAMGAADRQEGGAVVEALVKANIEAACGKDLAKALEEKPLLPLPGELPRLRGGCISQRNVKRPQLSRQGNERRAISEVSGK